MHWQNPMKKTSPVLQSKRKRKTVRVRLKSTLKPLPRIVPILGIVTAIFLLPSSSLAGEVTPRSDLGPAELALVGSNGAVARVTQIGEVNDATLTQLGTQHQGLIYQSGSANEVAAVQSGRANEFSANQAGSGNEIALTQAGRANIATVNQVGNSHRATIEQSGNSNAVHVQQLPLSPNLFVQQQGHGLAAKVIQY